MVTFHPGREKFGCVAVGGILMSSGVSSRFAGFLEPGLICPRRFLFLFFLPAIGELYLSLSGRFGSSYSKAESHGLAR